MNIILVTGKDGKAWSVNFGRRRVLLPVLAVFAMVCGLLLLAGYTLGRPSDNYVQVPETPHAWEAGLASKFLDLEEKRRSVDLHLNALALRLGQMQAQMTRLNVLGQRLTEMADLDRGEFNFGDLPARGGPDDPQQTGYTSAPEFLEDLDQLSHELQDRRRQLAVLETLLMNRNVHKQVFPAGRPVESGWISSRYGTRRNPFSGQRETHKGVDFAGKKGSDVIAVAAGVVTSSQKRSGYGRLIEIDHGSGYVTRYAHNEQNLVKPGDRVAKGQRIALMGSSGRSTGPHVHFEVLHNGRKVNPTRYIRAGS